MKTLVSFAVALASASGCVSNFARAATYDLTFSGDVANFSESQFGFNNSHYDEYNLTLNETSNLFPITVSQGDSINSTVSLDQSYTIAQSQEHTDILQYLTGASFPNENTGVVGQFTFYDGGQEVATYGYYSTTSGQLASYAAVFPPANGALTFDSFTNDFTINYLPSSANLDGSAFTYALVSSAVPELSTWAMTIAGFAALGFAGYRGTRRRAPSMA